MIALLRSLFPPISGHLERAGSFFAKVLESVAAF